MTPFLEGLQTAILVYAALWLLGAAVAGLLIKPEKWKTPWRTALHLLAWPHWLGREIG